jgi:hypothetical protein
MSVATKEARFPIITATAQLCLSITARPEASHEEARRGCGGALLCCYMPYCCIKLYFTVLHQLLELSGIR